MKGLSMIFFASLLFMTASCKSKEPPTPLEVNNKIKQIVFFSDEENLLSEASYYDAIIELKDQFPREINNMMIIEKTKAEKYFDEYKIDNCPAIIVLYKDEVVVKIDGKSSKEKIIKPVAKALVKDS